MDRQEKVTRRAKDAIITFLVAVEQPKSEEEAIELMDEWERVSYADLLKTLDYVSKHHPYRNAVLENHVNYCIREAERVKTQKQLAGVGT